ncbi:MAG: ribbon-helix-helix protein, CopG family [Thermoleophilia bacterium]
MDDAVVAVELNAQQLELLDRLCAQEGYADHAEALRAGLRAYLATEAAA